MKHHLSLALCTAMSCTSKGQVEDDSSEDMGELEDALFKIHFSVITNGSSQTDAASLEQLEKEVDILNMYFLTEDRRSIVTFDYNSASLFSDHSDSDCALIHMSQEEVAYHSDDWATAINDCTDDRVVKPNAINIFIYDSYSNDDLFEDVTSRGRLNNNHPYVLLDWERLDHTTQSPEEHEMGHAFGLEHICVLDAELTTSTNIMASSGDYPAVSGAVEDCPYSGGLRDIGFNSVQEGTVISNAEDIWSTLW
jgi:hypothetical protein